MRNLKMIRKKIMETIQYNESFLLHELFDKTLKPYNYKIVYKDKDIATWQFWTDSGLLYEFQVYDSETIFDDDDFSYAMLTSEFYVVEENDTENYSYDMTNKGEFFVS